MTESLSHIEVAVALPVERTLTYAVPASLSAYATIGKRVLAPLGRRRVTGYVLGPGNPDGRYRIKRILDVLDEVPLFPPEMIPFFRWIADYYMHPIGEVIKCALPGGLNVYDWVVLSVTEAGKQALSVNLPPPPEIDLLRHLLENGPCRIKDLPGGLKKNLPAAVIPVLEDRGWVVRRRELRGGITRTKLERFVCPPEETVPVEGLSEPRQKILRALTDYGEMSIPELKKHVPTAANLVRPMADAGQVVLSEKPVYRDPFGDAIAPDTPRRLTGEQEQVVSTLLESLGQGFRAYLLAGVTGSGKTEVYLQAAHAVLEQGLPVLVLVPEIALISQMERRFRARFGERVAVLHSGLSDGERYDQWVRILQGEAPVVIGARSAVFAPLPAFGMIIVDEEHDTSYKQGSDLLYNGRDLAVVRAKLSGAAVLLGSATPSIQSYYNVRSQKFTELTL
ncbi:MAG: DEAD/DEAH box helicase, partial [Thermodesulfobacteriota bacterium]